MRNTVTVFFCFFLWLSAFVLYYFYFFIGPEGATLRSPFVFEMLLFFIPISLMSLYLVIRAFKNRKTFSKYPRVTLVPLILFYCVLGVLYTLFFKYLYSFPIQFFQLMLRSSYIVVFGQLSAVILIIVSYFVLERKVSLGESEISVPPAREEVTLIRKDTMHFYYVLASFICVTGLLVSSLYGRYIDQGERHDLLARASYIANATNAADLSSLSGTESDLGSNSYLRLKQFLYDTRSANADVRFLYYFRSNGEKLFFLVDSEFPSSADYSPPGQVYEETSELEFNNYNNQVSFVEGPYSDSWGTWISAYAPVIYNGEQVGQFGMDIDASKWKMLIWQKMFYIVLAGVVAAAVALYAGYRRTYR